MHKLTFYLLWVYALLSAYVVLSAFFGVRYQPFFTPLLTLVAFVFALLHGSQRLGWGGSFLFLALTFLVSLVFESVGVATGLVYGLYHYTNKLGPLFLDLVPYLIPLAWFMMIYPSVLIAAWVVPAQQELWRWRLGTAALAALVMCAWDLVMDPMMVNGGHWVWEVQGAYFGIPLQNYWGWWLTTFTIFALFLWLGRIEPSLVNSAQGNFDRLAIWLYAVTGLGNIAVTLQSGLGGPALVGLFAMSPWFLFAWLKTSAARSDFV